MAPVVYYALQDIARSHVARETPRRVRLPFFFCMLTTGETLISSWGPEGKVLWLRFRELFSDGVVGRNVRRRFGGGALRALPNTG